MGLLKEGEIVGSTYEVERLLGEGAFAKVYRVKHRFLGRQAMKVFKLVGMTVEEVERSLAEASFLSRLGHPNIIRVFEANVATTAAGKIGYFTMEYLAGGTLSAFRRSFGKACMPLETATDVIQQVCCALSVAHASKPPIIHRDVKPQNILIGFDAERPRARLSDFGLAKHVNPLTLQASVQGTRSFKPPESFLGGDADSCSGDAWAVGLCLYLLLTDTPGAIPMAAKLASDLIAVLRTEGAPDEVIESAMGRSAPDN
jgi:eukaryotic-like serine/threonine-protein kinase